MAAPALSLPSIILCCWLAICIESKPIIINNGDNNQNTNNSSPTTTPTTTLLIHYPNNNIPSIIITFPPAHCLKDSDCIGKNSSSKVFYDPNGRCDIRQNQCICREPKRYRRVQIKVNLKSSSSSSSSAIAATNHNPTTASNNNSNHNVVYVTKCMPIDNLQSNNNHGSADDHHQHQHQQHHQQRHQQQQQQPQQHQSTIKDNNKSLQSSIVSLRPHYYGQQCDDDRQCSANMICRQLIVASKIKHQHQQQQQSNSNASVSMISATSPTTATSAAAVNLTQMLTVKRCRCPLGQHWNKYIRRCEWIHSNSLFQFGLAQPSLPITNDQYSHNNPYEQQTYGGPNGGYSSNNHLNGNNLINGISSSSNGHSTASNHHPTITTTNIDLKIFEIVLEIAFLLACLLGYKACSSICCKDQDQQQQQQSNDSINGYTTDICYGSGDDDHDTFTIENGVRIIENGRDIKSDEESILGSSSTTAAAATANGTTSKSATSVPNLMAGLKAPSNDSNNTKLSQQTSRYAYNSRTSIKQSRRQSRKRRVSRFCARTMARRNSTYASSSSGSSSTATTAAHYTNQNFRRLSSVSASAISRSSSSSTRNLLVKITNPSADKSLSVSTMLAPQSPNVDIHSGGSNSRTSSPCYNCRIYKEVYSPSAQCKSCRSLLSSAAAVAATTSADIVDKSPTNHHHKSTDLSLMKNNNNLIDFDSLLLMVNANNNANNNHQNNNENHDITNTIGESSDHLSSLSSSDSNSNSNNNHQLKSPSSSSSSSVTNAIILPPPSYKQKPIRRSEEVGVPPHLRAPYRDSQPFWLK